MVGVATFPISGTADLSRVEAPVTLKAYLLCAFAAFGGIFFGYDTGWMSGVLAMPFFITQYAGIEFDYALGKPIGVDPIQFGLPSSTKSLMTSILSCGTFFGALIAGDVGDFIGRRPTIIIGCVVFCVGCILEIASANQVVLFVMGRLLSGLGVGFISAIILLYMSEVAPRRVRGALVSGYQFCITLGILLANCVTYATANRNDTGSYRIPVGIQFLWALILGIGLSILCKCYPYAYPESQNFIFYFGTTFFQQLGTMHNPFLISLVATLVNALSTPLSFWAIEKLGRRPLLICGAIRMIVSQFIVATVGVTAGRAEVANYDAVRAMIALICIYIFFFASTWAPCFPLPIRSRGVGVSTASNWFWNCIIGVITPYMVGNEPGSANLGPKVFYIWGSLCFLSLAFAYFLVPEMKGLTLEQIDGMMEETAPRKSGAWKPTTTFAAQMGRVRQEGSPRHEKQAMRAV
ncbi:general substrate transporter [Parathielavia appendiculata]|uniref:General substrate transporter n=1 Tax=Parathielavia appendiculata TaxID=2587402 RepID=A0AAN6U3W0_9PEZI|nr:general substrate transporter [Parathielavia appendiculata]